MIKPNLFLLLLLSIVCWHPIEGKATIKLLSQSAMIGSTDSTKARVVNIYPTTNHIPINLLRFYVEFSQPMREGNFLQHIRMTDENGADMSGVFFDNQYELWNQDYTKLTILIDPGRVKTGLAAHEKRGRAFEVGKEYTLTIDKNWLTIAGGTLGENFSKTFIGASEIMEGIDYATWEIQSPISSIERPLKILFGQALDHVSAQRYIVIVDIDDNLIEGEKLLKKEESELLFYPASKWEKGTYRIVINSRIEDIVGNNINGAFDHKIGTLKDVNEGLPIVIPFLINEE